MNNNTTRNVVPAIRVPVMLTQEEIKRLENGPERIFIGGTPDADFQELVNELSAVHFELELVRREAQVAHDANKFLTTMLRQREEQIRQLRSSIAGRSRVTIKVNVLGIIGG